MSGKGQDERLAEFSDPADRKRIKEALAHMTFGKK